MVGVWSDSRNSIWIWLEHLGEGKLLPLPICLVSNTNTMTTFWHSYTHMTQFRVISHTFVHIAMFHSHLHTSQHLPTCHLASTDVTAPRSSSCIPCTALKQMHNTFRWFYWSLDSLSLRYFIKFLFLPLIMHHILFYLVAMCYLSLSPFLFHISYCFISFLHTIILAYYIPVLFTVCKERKIPSLISTYHIQQI
jgi:hypothetical protein